MSEEIKEKIDKSKENHRYNITSSREWFENLLDYITNLQQENKQLKEQKEEIYLWALNRKCELDALPATFSYAINGNKLNEVFKILGDKE